MAATVQTNNADAFSEINTTPLIDVMLVLLTLLIITLPMQTHAIEVDTPHGLPPATQPPPVVTLGIEFDGTTTWNGTTVNRATLDAHLADAARKNPQPDIHVRADRLARYDAVTRVLAATARAGETHVAFDDTVQ